MRVCTAVITRSSYAGHRAWADLIGGTGAAMTVHVGTSGWTSPPGTGVLYPPAAPPGDRLGHYVRRFHTVELNASFYRWPRTASFAGWQRRLPGGFRLSVKAP